MILTPQEFFTLLSDETRLRALLLLHKRKELCVCELSTALDTIQPKISRHLSLLRKSGLVQDKRKGQWVYYRISEKIEGWMKEVLDSALKGLKAREPFCSDCAKSLGLEGKNLCK